MLKTAFLLAGLTLALPALAEEAAAPQPASPSAEAKPAKTKAKKASAGLPKTAVIEMESGGKITFKFFNDGAPNTVANFAKLADKGFYNGLTFHRVEPGFVVQGGDPNGNGSGGPGYTIKAEFNDHLHERGAVAMARTPDPDSAGSQFYICLAPAHFLDHQYTVFGQVTSGMDVVDRIRIGDKMKKVTIQR